MSTTYRYMDQEGLVNYLYGSRSIQTFRSGKSGNSSSHSIQMPAESDIFGFYFDATNRLCVTAEVIDSVSITETVRFRLVGIGESVPKDYIHRVGISSCGKLALYVVSRIED